MGTTAPRVSIGMAVRNGQRFIREAVDSMLSQTYSDLEVVICDNASSDSTQQICKEYAARDPRVRYHRQPYDVGPAANFNTSFQMSRGEYFKWAAHDDVLAPEYVQKCIEALDGDGSLVLVYPSTTIIDEQSRPVESYEFRISTDSPDPVKRFAQLVLVNHRRHRAVEIFGLMRASALRRTPLQGCYARADSVLLARLALLGRFIELPQRLFLSRRHAAQSMQTLPGHARWNAVGLARYLGTGPLPPPEWWDSSLKGKISFPEWNLLKEYWRSISAAPLSGVQRTRCRLIMLKWVVLNLHKLVRDLIFAAEQLIRRAWGTRSSPSGAQAAN